jgi:hypothetical protein
MLKLAMFLATLMGLMANSYAGYDVAACKKNNIDVPEYLKLTKFFYKDAKNRAKPSRVYVDFNSVKHCISGQALGANSILTFTSDQNGREILGFRPNEPIQKILLYSDLPDYNPERSYETFGSIVSSIANESEYNNILQSGTSPDSKAIFSYEIFSQVNNSNHVIRISAQEKSILIVVQSTGTYVLDLSNYKYIEKYMIQIQP